MDSLMVRRGAFVVALVVVASLLLITVVLALGGLSSTRRGEVYPCQSAFGLTDPPGAKPVSFIGYGGPFTYDGVTGCGDVRSSRRNLTYVTAVVAVLAGAGAWYVRPGRRAET